MAKELDARVKVFGRRIKALRETTPELSQEALAAAVGYSRSAIANLETGRLDPVLGRAFALADFFHMALEQLLSESDQELRRPLSREGRQLVECLHHLEARQLALLWRCAALLQHQPGVVDHLDRQVAYIEDAIKLRRLQQGGAEGEDTGAPAG